MSYRNGKKLLPPKLLSQVQRYVQGETVYIPRKEGEKAAWGDKNQARAQLKARNREIFARYQSGEPVCKLAQAYFLSEKTIYRILAAERKRLSKTE